MMLKTQRSAASASAAASAIAHLFCAAPAANSSGVETAAAAAAALHGEPTDGVDVHPPLTAPFLSSSSPRYEIRPSVAYMRTQQRRWDKKKRERERERGDDERLSGPAVHCNLSATLFVREPKLWSFASCLWTSPRPDAALCGPRGHLASRPPSRPCEPAESDAGCRALCVKVKQGGPLPDAQQPPTVCAGDPRFFKHTQKPFFFFFCSYSPRMERDGNICEDDALCAEEEEEVDPRIQGELEKLNQSTDDINRLESELEDFRQRFRAVLVEATVKLDEVLKKIGRAVDDSKPYWEARKVARRAQVEAQKATQEFQRAVEILRAAKETIALAEEKLLEEDTRQFDSAWQEMLNHATQRVMEAEQARTRSEAEHKKTAVNYNSSIGHMKQIEKKLKRSINKSRPYFELKAKYYLQLEQLKQHVDDRQAKLVVAKSEYRAALRSLESISEEIHAHRRSHAMGTRERGVGAEVDEGHDDIANFKMESDGLSMVSVSVDEESSRSSEEEEDTHTTSLCRTTPSSPSSSYSHPSTSASTPMSMPRSSGYPPFSFLAASSSSSSSCPEGLESEALCASHGPDLMCSSGHVSPVLGPRSQCSGASSPDCDQERGDRAEGAEASLEGGLSKLALTASRNPGESEDEEDPHYINPELTSPSSAASVLLLNGV
uniref:SH3 domain-binding protein 5 n=2 Tax=Xiphophorus maculatus TaxID=8083 RepID=A0A3B5QX57_XIPMA